MRKNLCFLENHADVLAAYHFRSQLETLKRLGYTTIAIEGVSSNFSISDIKDKLQTDIDETINLLTEIVNDAKNSVIASSIIDRCGFNKPDFLPGVEHVDTMRKIIFDELFLTFDDPNIRDDLMKLLGFTEGSLINQSRLNMVLTAEKYGFSIVGIDDFQLVDKILKKNLPASSLSESFIDSLTPRREKYFIEEVSKIPGTILGQTIIIIGFSHHEMLKLNDSIRLKTMLLCLTSTPDGFQQMSGKFPCKQKITAFCVTEPNWGEQFNRIFLNPFIITHYDKKSDTSSLFLSPKAAKFKVLPQTRRPCYTNSPPTLSNGVGL